MDSGTARSREPSVARRGPPARRVVSRRSGKDAVKGERLAVVESTAHGVSLLGDARDAAALPAPIAPDVARGLVAALG